jgi:hypothetical protein
MNGTAGQFLASFICHPAYCSKFPSGGNTKYRVGAMGWYSLVFKYWRGSLDYLFYITASTTVKATYRIVWHPDIENSSVSDDQSGDVISKVFEVQGDTIIRFKAPFISNTIYNQVRLPAGSDEGETDAWGDFDDNVASGSVVLEQVSAVADAFSSLDSHVACHVWVAAGEDFEFAFPQDVPYLCGYDDFTELPETPPAALKPKYILHKHCDVSAEFLKPFDCPVAYDPIASSGVVMGEKSLMLADLCHRYAYRDDTPDMVRVAPRAIGSFADGHTPNWHFHLLAPFNWFRSSVRFKYLFQPNGTPNSWEKVWVNASIVNGDASTDPRGGIGIAMAHSANDNVLSFEVPFATNVPYLRTYQSQTATTWYYKPPYVALNDTSLFGKLYYSMGDDLSVGGMHGFWTIARPTVIPPLLAPLPPKEKKSVGLTPIPAT